MAVHSLASRACTIATPYSSQPAPRGPRSRRAPAGGPVAVRRSACPSSSELLSLLLCCPSSALRASARCASGHVACSSSRTPDPPRRVQRPLQPRCCTVLLALPAGSRRCALVAGRGVHCGAAPSSAASLRLGGVVCCPLQCSAACTAAALVRLAAATVNPVKLMISSESSDQEQESKRQEQYLVNRESSDLVMGTGRNGLSFSRAGKPQSNASRSNSLASCELARCSDARVSAAAATARSLVIWTDARCTVHLEVESGEWRVEE